MREDNLLFSTSGQLAGREGGPAMDLVTVQKLMDTEIFKKHVHLLGGAGGLAKEVTYVTVQEAPDFHEFICGGEFVLSTWYAFRNDYDEGFASLKNLAAKASAVCIKTNRFLKEIPQEYIDYANEKDLPLFIVDRDVIFREIIRCITVEINLSYMDTLIKANEYYDFLLQAALENKSADILLLDFYKRTGIVALSISRNFEQIRGAASFQNREARAGDFEKRVSAVAAAIQKNLFQQTYFSEDPYHIFPCMARGYTRGYCYGYLVVIKQGVLSEAEKIYINQLSNIITIKWMARYETENDYLIALLNMIKFSPESKREEIDRMLKGKSIACESGVRALLLLCDAGDKSKNGLAEAQQFLSEFSAVISNMVFVWDRESHFTILIDNQDDEDAAGVDSLISKLAEIIGAYKSLRLSVGPSMRDIADLASSVRIAQNAFLFCDHLEGQIIYFKEYLANMSALAGIASKESELLVKELIQPIARHDEENGSLVLETLAAALQCKDLNATAESLNLHINSVRYRLQKIKKITGRDYFDINERFEIASAYQIYRHRNGFKEK